MSDTPGNERERGGPGEFSDPTAPSYDSGSGSEGTTPEPSEPTTTPGASGGEGAAEGAREVTWSSGDATQAVPAGETQQLPSTPPAAPGPASQTPGGPSYGQAGSPQSPYGQQPQQPSPYGQTPGQAPSPYSQPQQPGPYGQPQGPYVAGQQPARPAPGAGQGYPYGQQPGYGQQGYGQAQPYGYGQSPYAPARRTNGSAIALLIVSGVSTLFGCIFAIPAVILAILALVKQDDSPSDSARLSRWGWIAYGIAVALVVVGGIIAIAVVASTSSVSGY
jgi:hypothetical protein